MDNHLILLRFNVFAGNYLQYGQYTREQMYEGNPSWLDIRLKWFDNYLLENLKNQEDKDFWCFLMSDPETPPHYKAKIKEYEKLGFIKVLETYDEDLLAMNNNILPLYKSVKKNDSNEIICSRLDTDDMVGPYWNVAVKQLLEDQDRVSLETVLLYNFLNKETRMIKYSKGSFVSTKSTLDKFDNPRGFSHGSSNALSVDTEYPLVCMGVHDNNITNQNWWPAGRPINLEKDTFDQMFKIKR